MENNMYTKPMYKCAICDSVYESVSERMKCEQKCIRKQEEEAKKAAELKKQQEYATRKADTDAKVKAAIDAVSAYTKDYGFYTYDGDITNMIGDIVPSKLLHYFF